MARILVVEDEAQNLELMVYLLDALGHHALVARDGSEAVVMVTEQQPDLVVMDLRMPVMDGFEAAAVIKADPCLRSVSLIAVTAYAMVGDREKVLAAGFDGYLTKPIDPRTFVRDIEKYLPPDATRPIPTAAEREA